MQPIRSPWWSRLLLLTLFVAAPLLAQQAPPKLTDEQIVDGWGCTSIMVGRLATTDGSVITSHTCDGNYRTWLRVEPRRHNHPGETTKVWWGLMHNETPGDLRGVEWKGEIPDVTETYAFLNTAYPCLNEQQLAIGETTINGRRELRNRQGLFLIEELQRIALERCKTARAAIALIGELVAKYGYGDGGECLTFADPKEVWHFEIMGAGPKQLGAVWAAVRIPDDHVGVSANLPRIGTLDLSRPDQCMASANVQSLAQEMGFWDPASGEPFQWWKAYSGQKPYGVREYYVLSQLAPDLQLTMTMEQLPFSVRPQKQVSVRDVMALFRCTYEGTEFDMTRNLVVEKQRGRRGRGGEGNGDGDAKPELVKSPLANNWSAASDLAALANHLAPGTVQRQRPIAVTACAYSQVLQCRDGMPPGLGAIAWFSFDNPGQSPRIPIFAGALRLPDAFAICGQKRYREDAAVWQFRRANRLAMIRWGATRESMERAIAEYEEKAFAELPGIEAKALAMYQAEVAAGVADPQQYREFLTRYTNDFALAAMATWWELGNRYFTMFARGW